MTARFVFLLVYTAGWLLFAWGTFAVVEWRLRKGKR